MMNPKFTQPFTDWLAISEQTQFHPIDLHCDFRRRCSVPQTGKPLSVRATPIRTCVGADRIPSILIRTSHVKPQCPSSHSLAVPATLESRLNVAHFSPESEQSEDLSASHPFYDGGDALAEADAHGGEAEGSILLLHVVEQGGGDAGAGAA